LREINNYSSLTFTCGNTGYGYVAAYAGIVNTNKEEPKTYYIRDNNFIYRSYNSNYYLVSYEGEEKVLTLPEQYNEKTYYLDSYCLAGL
jgi:hypothetical protein